MPCMAGNIIKNIFHKPVTRQYPLQRRKPFAGVRGRIIFEPAKCEFCGDCERICPAQAIVLDTAWEQVNGEPETVWVRIYHPHRCIFCGACVEVCAYGALSFAGEHLPPTDHKPDERERVEAW